MSIQSLLFAAHYLDYKAETEARGEEPQDYNSFLLDGNSIECFSSSEHENFSDNTDVSELKQSQIKTSPNASSTVHEKSISREAHNRLEKNRRAQMKEGFEKLKHLTPAIGSSKVSNLKLLREVTKYIKELKEELHANVSEVEQLKTQFATLRARRESLTTLIPSVVFESLINRGNEVSKKETSIASGETADRYCSDESSLLLFSNIATMTASTAGSMVLDAHRSNPYFRLSRLSTSPKLCSSNGEAELDKSPVLSASEKLLALAEVEKGIVTKGTKEILLSKKSVEVKRKFAEISDPIKEQQISQENSIKKKSKAYKRKPSEDIGSVTKTGDLTRTSNISDVKRQCLSNAVGLKATEGMSHLGLATETFNFTDRKPVVNKALVGQNRSNICRVVASPQAVSSSNELPSGGCIDGNSILQKVLLNDESVYCKPSEVCASHAPTTEDTVAATELVQRSKNSFCLSHSSIMPGVTEASKIIVQNLPFQGSFGGIGKSVKMEKAGSQRLPSSVICNTNDNCAKLNGRNFKCQTSEAFEKLKQDSSFLQKVIVQSGSHNNVNLNGNDSKLCIVTVPNFGQKLPIKGSAV